MIPGWTLEAAPWIAPVGIVLGGVIAYYCVRIIFKTWWPEKW
jgi:hypothetical protein